MAREARERVADVPAAARPAMADESREGIRFFEPRVDPIAKATDLGSVQVLKHGNMFLLTDQFGDIHSDSRGLGLYRNDTRLLSCSVLRVGNARPVVLQGSTGANYRGVIQLTNPTLDRNPDDKIRPGQGLIGKKLGITRERLVTGDALQERVTIVNFAEHDETVDLTLELSDDAADIFEVRGYPRDRGTLLPIAARDDAATFQYDGLDGHRSRTHVAFSEPGDLDRVRPDDGPDLGGAIRYRWAWPLAAGAAHELSWIVWSSDGPSGSGDGRDDRGSLFPAPPRIARDEGAAAYHAWTRSTTSVSTDNELFNLTVGRSVADLRLLVNDGPGEDQRYIAAGVPWFTTLFGRDSIITAIQTLAFRPQIAVETLEVLASLQATEVDDWRDAEPGKILHEMRAGETARAGELPHSPYYGSIDSTPLWLILLGETFDWTGDRDLVDRLWPNAMAALRWIDEWGDRDGDGFVEYERRSKRGLLNQGWKDSGDAIRDRHGREARPPIALAEVQGYVYDAKHRLARLARTRGDVELAVRLDREADELQKRFEEAFWVEDQRYYAMALDGEKRQADAVGSNAGQCLWTGIVSPSRSRDVADRLLSPALYSGWGVRTYAADQPGFNPFGYHTGTVWPHDTSLTAAGLKRYGFQDEANRIVGHVFEAAQHFEAFRLPELFCGFDRDAAPMPVPYPVACSPQAWSAGATFMFLRTMLGLRAHADQRELELLRPNLPDWLGKVTVTNLRVGEASVDLLFHRWRGTTSAEVLRKVGDVSVTIRL
ncbi:MAG TPA: glycogen debranching N-terminal domain-containing protein [Candidatus Limnocylindrales bacterium]|nr:glycogen debranching N-terminal domain-containing protein [Candidatus Limnocylindrales bacterium]